MTDTYPHAAMSRSILHIFIFATFAVAQPLFDLFSSYPEFFIARHTSPADIWLLIAFLSLGVPALLVLILLPVRLLGMRSWTLAANSVIFVLFGLMVWRNLRLLDTGFREAVLLGVTAIITGIFGYFYTGRMKLREFVSFLSPAVIIFPLLLVFFSPLYKILFPAQAPGNGAAQFQKANNRNVVVLVFDEFPLFSLLNSKESIEAEKFPNFHALSQSATWYKYATAVADSTLRSLTSIITGRYPSNDRVWTHTSYPNNLFTLFARTHDIQAYESATDFCPKWVCGNEKTPEPDQDSLDKLIKDLGIVYAHMVTPAALRNKYLPVLGAAWKDFGANWKDEVNQAGGRGLQALKKSTINKVQAATREDSALSNYRNWLDKIRPHGKPGIYFHHIQLPHKPWKYYPDGVRYYPGGIDGLKDEVWTAEQGLVLHGYQRHLLQVAYVDHLLGLLLKKLRAQKLYDDALVIITADHGASFMEEHSRRILDEVNFADILRLPLFIKWPQQNAGEIRDDDAELVDLLPTIVRELGIDSDMPLDGKALSPRDRIHRETRIVLERTRDNKIRRKTYVSRDLKTNRGSLDRKTRYLDRVYAVGGFGLLLGKQPEEYMVAPESRLSFSLDYPGLIQEVDTSTGLLPGRIIGRISGWADDAPELPYVALAMNGNIVSTAKLYRDSASGLKFSAMVPDQAFHPGNNPLTLYLIKNNPDGSLALAGIRQTARQSKWKPIRSRKSRYFQDVQNWNAVSKAIYALTNQGIAGGCQPGLFCPDKPVTRAEAAVFLGKVMQGVNYQPPAPAQDGYQDIAGDARKPWISLLLEKGIMQTCRNDAFCPDAKISRGAFAKLLLKAKYGARYHPPKIGQGRFKDVPDDSPLAPWIEAIAAEGITTGCATQKFCPEKALTRGDAALWLVQAFDIPSSE